MGAAQKVQPPADEKKKGKDRRLVSFPKDTVRKLEDFRAREWKEVPAETRAHDISFNSVVLRLLAIEEQTRPAPERHPDRPKRTR